MVHKGTYVLYLKYRWVFIFKITNAFAWSSISAMVDQEREKGDTC